MELVECGTLSSFIEECRNKEENIPEAIILKLFSQLVSVLKYCSDNRIVHKDIKSNNILYSKSGVVKLADFGLSKILPINKEEFERNNSSAGSTPYVSPELLGQNPYSFLTDIWSLGVVIYEMMTLEYPFDGSNSQRIFHQIIDEEEDFSEITGDYSDELKDIFYRMLVKCQYERIHIDKLSENPIFDHIDIDKNPFGSFLMAMKYLVGYDVEKNIEESVKHAKMSAELNDSNGCFLSGFGLEKGYLGEINLPEAMKYYKMSTDLGYPVALLFYRNVITKIIRLFLILQSYNQ
jgi:serine/threonine protein kinase